MTSRSIHEKITKEFSITLREAKDYLRLCSKGLYPSSYYHKNKCKRILEAFGDFLYYEDEFLYKTAVGMIENKIQK